MWQKNINPCRESGFNLELNDITNNSFLPEEVLRSNNNDELYKSIEEMKTTLD